MVLLVDIFSVLSCEGSNKLEGYHHVAVTSALTLETTIAFIEAGGLGAHNVIDTCARLYAINIIAEV